MPAKAILNKAKLIKYILILSFSLLLASCATTPTGAPPYSAQGIHPPVTGPMIRSDIYHIVAPGETLWRIGKMYDVGVDAIKAANNLRDPRDLKIGMRLRIPAAAPAKPVIPLYPSKKWKYIIIHHSATDAGNAYSLFALHLKRGFSDLGYDFIIDNGTSGKSPGQIEVGRRWIKQQDGAHCKASGMNYCGIGICLVGNFSKEFVPKEQMDSLVYLVNILRKYYNIPVKNIMGHGQVPGARTECPGKNFPWEEFKRRLY